MTPQRAEELVDLLNAYDVAGTSFHQAKQELLVKGFTEAEIVHALYSAPFDGKVNTKEQSADPLHDYYAKHPEKADRLAKSLLLEDAEQEWNEVAAHAVASQVPLNTHTESRHQLAVADSLGIPYFRLLLLMTVLGFASIVLDIDKQIMDLLLLAAGILVAGLFIFKLAQRRMHLRRLRREVRQQHR